MTKSAHVAALLLIALNQPAFGDSLIVAEEDGSATPPQVMEPVYGPVLPGEVIPETDTVGADGVDENKEFDRLFGAKPPVLSKKDQQVVSETKAAAWPWWSWPLGLIAIGALLFIRNRVTRTEVPRQAMTIVARQHMGKDGTLALVELADGDHRTRRLLVGLGGGAPRLVADVSAWEVAVAAPANIANDAIAMVGPDPDEQTVTAHTEAQSTIALVPPSFDTHLNHANNRYAQEAQATTGTVPAADSRVDLIEEVMAAREMVRKETVSSRKASKRKPAYSSREIVA